MVGIYKITNTVNQKIYIGQSIDIKKRFSRHKTSAFNKNSTMYNSSFYKAIRKYGLSAFTFEILEECPKDVLDDKEQQYIKQYQSNDARYGYNMTEGGKDCPSAPQKLNQDKAKQIVLELKNTNKTNQQIASQFGVSEACVRQIGYGEIWHFDKESYPIRTKRPRSSNGVHVKPRPRITNRCAHCGKNIWKESTMCAECQRNWQKEQSYNKLPDPIILAQKITSLGFFATGKEFNVSDTTIRKWCKKLQIPHTKKELSVWYHKRINGTNTTCYE